MSLKRKVRNFMPSFVTKLYDWGYFQYIKTFPKAHAAHIFKEYYGRKLNWDNPTILSEKGRWIQFNTDTSSWSLLADKYKVRDFYKNIGLGDYIPELYGIWKDAKDIDFDKLPDSFVIKTNHGCGEVIVVKNKNTVNLEKIREKIQVYLKNKYGVWTAEPHYLKISPVIMAEELLSCTCPDSSSMVDYKIFCSWGKILFLDICYDRDANTHHALETWYDVDWNKRDDWYSKNDIPKLITRPKSLDKMYGICRRISENMPLVRIDFYDVNGKPYIGELTFTPNGFNPELLTPKAMRAIGDMIDISSLKR